MAKQQSQPASDPAREAALSAIQDAMGVDRATVIYALSKYGDAVGSMLNSRIETERIVGASMSAAGWRADLVRRTLIERRQARAAQTRQHVAMSQSPMLPTIDPSKATKADLTPDESKTFVEMSATGRYTEPALIAALITRRNRRARRA
jgi:hypothetical protein